MNLLTLTDSKLAALHHQASNEIARRAKAAVNGHDAATIIRGNEMAKRAVLVAAAGNHSILLVGPPNCGKTMLRALALDLGHSNDLRGPALPVRIPRQSASGLQLFMLQDRAVPGTMADRRHNYRGSRAAATRTQRTTGNGSGRNEGPNRPRDKPHGPDAKPGLGQPCSRQPARSMPSTRMPETASSPSPGPLPTLTETNGSRLGIFARRSIIGRSDGEASHAARHLRSHETRLCRPGR